MPKFINSKDLNFIKTISEEVVNSVVEQLITLFKMSVGESKTNLYGESLGKIYHEPANLMCIVDKEPQRVSYEGFGANIDQPIEFRFMRHKLRTFDIPKVRDLAGLIVKDVDSIQNTTYGYPEIGDIIFFDSTYYEINQVEETKLVGGSPQILDPITKIYADARMQLIVTAFMVRRSQVQIEERTY